jgi:hypothetical protein
MSKKYSYDTIGNRTRDLPVCSAVPQPTAPPPAPTLFAQRTKCIARSRQPLFLPVSFKARVHKSFSEKNTYDFVKFDVLTAVNTKLTIFWNVTSTSLFDRKATNVSVESAACTSIFKVKG